MNLFELFAKITLDTGGFEKALGIATSALATATAAVGGFAMSSVNVGKDFDKAMSQVAATMGKTTEEMQGEIGSVETSFGSFTGTLRDFAQFMGSNTAFSATEAAEALNYMALAGYDAQKSMQMLPNVLSLAAAGGMDLAQASDMITDAESALGLKTEDVVAMVDQMAKTASKSNTSVSQLGDAILTIGGTASMMAGGTDRLNTVLGLLADNGIKGGEAGTHLRNMLLKLSAPTEDGAKAIEELGLTIFDSQGKMRDFEDIIGDLNKAFDGMTDEKKIGYISRLFNARDISAVNALLNTSKDRWTELSGAIVDSRDAASAMAETQLDNLAGDVTLFKSAMEGAQIIMSDQLTPGIRKFVQFGTKAVGNLSTAFGEKGLSGAMEEFGKLLSEGLSMIVSELPTLVDAGANLLMSLGQGIINNLPVLANTMLTILTMLGQKLTENMPIMIETITQVLSDIAAFLTNPDTMASLAMTMFTIYQTLAQAMLDNLPTLIETVLLVVQNIITYVQENAPKFLELAANLMVNFANGLLNNLPFVLSQLPTIINGIANAILSMMPTIVQTGVTLLSALVKSLPTIIQNIVSVLPTIIKSIVDNINTLLPIIIDAGITLFTALIDALPEIIVTILNALPEIIASITEALMNMLPTIVEAGFKLFTALVGAMPQIIRAIVQKLPQIVASIVSSIAAAFPQMVSTGSNLIKGLWQGIANVGEWLRQKISGFFGGVVDSIKKFFGISSPSKVFAGIGEMLDRGLAKGVGDYAKLAVNAAEDMAEDVFDATNRDFSFVGSGAVDGRGWRSGERGVVINVYGAEGQDVNELAEVVSQKIAFVYTQEQAVWA